MTKRMNEWMNEWMKRMKSLFILSSTTFINDKRWCGCPFLGGIDSMIDLNMLKIVKVNNWWSKSVNTCLGREKINCSVILLWIEMRGEITGYYLF